MSIGAEQAIEIARGCSRRRASLRWSDERVSARRAMVRGRDCWVVSTDAPAEAEAGRPPWFEIFTDTAMDYLVDRESGECFGVRAGQTCHYFTAAPAPDRDR